MRVLGLARANNCAIMLAAFSDVPGGAAGLRAALLTGAPALGAERLALLVQVRPLMCITASCASQNVTAPERVQLLVALGAERMALHHQPSSGQRICSKSTLLGLKARCRVQNHACKLAASN